MWLHASITKIDTIQSLIIWLGIWFASSALADPLLNTDDSEIVAKQHCQLETAWVSAAQKTDTEQLNAACQLLDGLESSVMYSAQDTFHQDGRWAAQIKGVLVPINRWGMAASMRIAQQKTETEQYTQWSVNVPFGLVLLNNQLSLYANLGYQYAAHQDDLMLWSAAADYALQPKTHFSVEIYNQDRQAPFVQSALHYDLIPNVFSMEAAWGQRLDAFRQRWFGLGFSFSP